MFDVLKVSGVCPILASAQSDAAVPAAKALVAGGVPVIEVLQRSENSMENLRNIAMNVPEICVGAGTVYTLEKAEEAVDNGAQFIVMPGFGREVVEFCLKKGVPVIPGCVTPAEITMALEYGIETIKFYPVYQMGGIAVLNEYSGTFPMIRFVITGALNQDNFLPLMSCTNVLAAGGDWMFTQGQALKNGDFDMISKNLRASVYKLQDLRNRLAIGD
ncbi:KHG/KDPG aldolase [bioreactor metagenome]|jgi:2-dehydro-3-deoxyphosphogluconate aldolase/(4S)-4-hydroxy-2-oxoglutarate aldolase|uniref:KHG/KDPG aldolase n=1 Tax=bioreactor metagenome TaxID=1076179 RepID=A0A645E4A7_9ZZZZ